VVFLFVACASQDGKSGDDASVPTSDSPTDSVRDTTGSDSDSDTTEPTPTELPDTVLVITQDAFNRRFYGWRADGVRTTWGWDTTPYTDSLWAEGVSVPEVVMARPLTAVSLGTLLTGSWPRNHHVRQSADQFLATPTLPKLYAEAGYTTAAIFSNRCGYTSPDVVPGWDRAVCNYEEGVQGVSQQTVEDEDVAYLQTILDEYPGERLFVWVHLINPHDELEAVEPWFTSFHPEAYKGDLDPMNRSDLDRVSTQGRAYTEEDRRFVEATYASAVRANDARIQAMVDAVEAAGRGERLLLVLGADHGEELLERPEPPYFWHPCTYYQGAGLTSWLFRGVGLRPGTVEGFVSAVDVAPTLLELSGLDPSGLMTDGGSLRSAFASGAAPDRPAFFERGDETAGVADGTLRYMLNPKSSFTCLTYDSKNPYTTPDEELYDLSVDPFELDNLVESEPALADAMRGTLCAHILDGTWSGNDSSNALVAACSEDPGSP